MATYTGIKKIKIGDNTFKLAVDWSDVTNQPTIPVNTDEKLKIEDKATETSGTTRYPIIGSGTTAATRQIDSTGFTYRNLSGGSGAGWADLTLGNNIAQGTSGNKQGKLILYGTTAYAHTIQGAPTDDRIITLPDKEGTVALLSDIGGTTSAQIVRWSDD